jgi:hypothetical protein
MAALGFLLMCASMAGFVWSIEAAFGEDGRP